MRNLLLFLFVPLIGLADDKAATLITSGGGEIALGKSVPGTVKLSGSAFSFLKGSNGRAIVAAGGEAGEGRLITFTHGSFLKSGELLNGESARTLVLNSMRWTGRNSKPKVGLHASCEELGPMLKESGIEYEVLDPEEVEGDAVDTYCLIGHDRRLTADDLAYLKEFVSQGGGLVISTTPWAFKKNHEDFAKDFPANQLSTLAGIEFQADGYAGSKTPLLVSRPNPVASPTQQGKVIRKAMETPDADTKNPLIAAARKLAAEHDKLPAAEKASLISQLERAKQLDGRDLGEFLAALRELNLAVGPIVPTKENPVIPGRDKLIDTIIDLETNFNLNLPAGAMYPIPAASDYPGKAETPESPQTHSVTISGKYKGWLSGRLAGGWAAKEMRPTGVYATPGEVIKVSVPARLAGEGFEVVVGAYNGGLNNRDKWHRYPKLQRSEKIESRETSVSNALGGLVTIRVPREADYDEIEVTIEGGIPAPLYVHGKTDVDEWKSEIRKRPGPWAELASERMIIALPSDYIRDLTNPDEVMELWNEIIDKAAELVVVDRNDYRAERIVFDRQTAAGSMHSSYPVAAHTGGAAEKAVDARRLRSEGDWGFFHEYGHNHQHNLWALPGTGETTCNLWSVYIYEELIGKNRDNTHGAMSPLNRRQKRNAYFDNGRAFQSEWSVWTALDTYLLIQEEFGWEPFKKVFDEYNRLDQEDWPKSQQEKNDQWVIRLSKAVGKNLHPYWEIWNLPMTDQVARELKDLPVWTDHPVAKFAIKK